jgi:purine-binding chemotaxis protein CheW
MSNAATLLVVRSTAGLCGLPVEHVVEILRPLPTQSLGQAPHVVLGLTRLRGEAVPVLDLDRVLGVQSDTPSRRYVSLRVGASLVLLAVQEVLDLRAVDRDAMASMPPMLAQGAPAVDAIASLDSGLLLVLKAAKFLPEPAWRESMGSPA